MSHYYQLLTIIVDNYVVMPFGDVINNVMTVLIIYEPANGTRGPCSNDLVKV